MNNCAFCDIVAGESPANIVQEWADMIAFRPLSPVVEGHTLIVPREHVRDAVERPAVTAAVMYVAAQFAARWPSVNILTSVGEPATQSIMHLHVHVIPRMMGDGLMVPWGTMHGENPRDPHRCRGMESLAAQVAELREAQNDEWTGVS